MMKYWLLVMREKQNVMLWFTWFYKTDDISHIYKKKEVREYCIVKLIYRIVQAIQFTLKWCTLTFSSSMTDWDRVIFLWIYLAHIVDVVIIFLVWINKSLIIKSPITSKDTSDSCEIVEIYSHSALVNNKKPKIDHPCRVTAYSIDISHIHEQHSPILCN